MATQAVKNTLYRWQGTDGNGVKTSGQISADSHAMIRVQLRRQGITAGKIRRHNDREPRKGKSITALDISLFTRQLATLIKAGIPLLQALEVIAKGFEHMAMRQLVSELKQDISAGTSLATALRNGAQGYLLKTMDGELLFEAIRRAARGEPVVSPELLGKLVTAFQSQGAPEPAAVAEGAQGTPAAAASPSPSPLSPREEEVLREIAQGASNKEIARQLDITERTVKAHVSAMLEKLGARDRLQLSLIFNGVDSRQ